jgi:hypothetical protein
MNGNQILEEVRILIDDSAFSRFQDINRAYRQICAKANWRWLRKSSTGLTFFNTTTNTYTLRTTDIQQILGVFIRGTSSSGTWIAPVEDRLDFTSAEPSAPATNARYINTNTGTSNVTTTAVTADYIYTWSGSAWAGQAPVTAYTTLVVDEDRHYQWDGTTWNIQSVNTTTWNQMEEVSTRQYEEKASLYQTGGNPIPTMPYWYKREGGPVETITITPSADASYDVRVDYIARPETITATTSPVLPLAYIDILIYTAVFQYFLRKQAVDQASMYKQLADDLWKPLLDNAFANTNRSIDKRAREFFV